MENGTSGHLTEENRGAGLNDLDLQVDRGGGVPQGRIELDTELAERIGNIAPDGDLARIGGLLGGEEVYVDLAGCGAEAGGVPGDVDR